MVTPGDRDRWIAMDDTRLLAACRVDAYRASGPGGQKRNKTSSAVRLRHEPSGLIVIAEESRSQHENKRRALRRLRLELALAIREPLDPAWTPPPAYRTHRTASGRIEIARRNPDYPLVVAVVLDAVVACEGELRRAAAMLDLSTAQLSRFLTGDGKLLATVNRLRHQAGLRPIAPARQ
ncbi:MAG: peptide chain release factor family protein [Phycisphaerae bacterium]